MRAQRSAPRRWPRWLTWILLPLLFAASCTALVPLGARLADPMTNAPLQSLPEMKFPVLVMSGGTPRVHVLADLRRIPELPPDSSYLIPVGEEERVQAAINAGLARDADGSWVLRVRQLGHDRQRIELFWMSDGYRGGVYEATRRSIRPLHRKITGPGFAFVAAGVALLVNGSLWAVLLLVVRSMRKVRTAARPAPSS